ncbi:MAG: hypothetical protein ACKVP0_17975 [Pirellulaceae bacterium]
MSDPNPYESPKEVKSPPKVKAGVALGALLLLSIPAGCICGTVTCHSVMAATRWNQAGTLLGMSLGLAIMLLVPVLAGWLFGVRKSP